MSKLASKKRSLEKTTWVVVGDTLPNLTRHFRLRLTHEQQEGLSLLCLGAAFHLPRGRLDFSFRSSTQQVDLTTRVRCACLHSCEWTRYVFDEEYVTDVIKALRRTPDTLEAALSAVGEVLLLPKMMREAESNWGEVASDRQVFESLTGEQRGYATSLAYSLNRELGVGALTSDGGILLGPAALFVAAAEISRARYPEPPPPTRRRRA